MLEIARSYLVKVKGSSQDKREASETPTSAVSWDQYIRWQVCLLLVTLYSMKLPVSRSRCNCIMHGSISSFFMRPFMQVKKWCMLIPARTFFCIMPIYHKRRSLFSFFDSSFPSVWSPPPAVFAKMCPITLACHCRHCLP